jgi:hypothetical protein
MEAMMRPYHDVPWNVLRSLHDATTHDEALGGALPHTAQIPTLAVSGVYYGQYRQPLHSAGAQVGRLVVGNLRSKLICSAHLHDSWLRRYDFSI